MEKKHRKTQSLNNIVSGIPVSGMERVFKQDTEIRNFGNTDKEEIS